MSQVLSQVSGIAVLILAVVLWILYHSIVKVTYFGNMGRHIFSEFFGCCIVSAFLVSTVVVFGGKILGVIGGLLGFVLKIALIGGAICLAVWLISVIVHAAKGKAGETPPASQAEQEQTVLADAEAGESDDPSGRRENERSASNGAEVP